MKTRIAPFLLALVCAVAANAQTPAPAPAPRAPIARGGEQMFHVALLVADSEPSKATPQDLPKGVQKAIADIRDFLPFKSYRIIDSALARMNGRGKVSLKGPNGESYTASLDYHELDTKGSFLVDQFALTRHAEEKPNAQPLPPGHAPKAPEQPLVSSFRITRGESVVVGSSSLGAGKALIVVLTAMP